MSVMDCRVLRLEPAFLLTSSGLFVMDDCGRADGLVLFTCPPLPAAIGVSLTFGHDFSSLSPLATLVPSFVPSLINENLAQFGSVTSCCC
jgi:hypothetical protein